jgi:hypothetical protein
MPELRPWLYVTYDARQGPGTRRQVLSHRGSGLPDAVLQVWPCWSLPRQGHAWGVTQEDMLPSASRGWVAPKPTRQPLELASFTTNKTPEGPPRGGWSKPT